MAEGRRAEHHTMQVNFDGHDVTRSYDDNVVPRFACAKSSKCLNSRASLHTWEK